MIRVARISDVLALYSLQKRLISYERNYDKAMKRNAVYYPPKELRRLIKSRNGRILVAEIDGEIVGCGFGRITKAEGWDAFDKKGYVGSMFVDPKFRGKGIGKKILSGLLDWFKERKVKDVQLNVYPNNERAVSFYEGFGFKSHLMYMRRKER